MSRTGSAVDRTFWAGYARVYDSAWDSPIAALIGQRVAELTGGPPGSIAVDVGCGTGLMSAALSRRGQRVVSVDASAAMLAVGRRRGRLARANVVATADATGLATGSVTTAVAVNVLHVVDDPEGVLGEMIRLCAPGAAIAVVWPSPGVDRIALGRAEKALGWSGTRRARAAAARAAVALPGKALRVRRHSAGTLHDLVLSVAAEHGLQVVVQEDFRRCQQLVVLATPLG